MFTSEFGLENFFSGFETGFPPWDAAEPPFLFDKPFPNQLEEPTAFFLPAEQTQDPITSSSGSDTSNPDPITPTSDSCKPTQNTASKHLISSTSEQTTLLASVIEERKRRRTQSNRESARRSRMRKQRHLENLGTQVNQQKRANLELKNRLQLVLRQNEAVCTENEHLRLDAARLRQRLWDIRQVLLVRRLQHRLNPFAWQDINLTSINERPLQNHPMITLPNY